MNNPACKNNNKCFRNRINVQLQKKIKNQKIMLLKCFNLKITKKFVKRSAYLANKVTTKLHSKCRPRNCEYVKKTSVWVNGILARKDGATNSKSIAQLFYIRKNQNV